MKKEPRSAGHREKQNKGDGRIPVVGLGASAGGLSALKGFFSNMPSDAGLAYVVVQHLHPGHKSMMAELISKCTDMEVIQVNEPVSVRGDHVYVAPPGKNLELSEGRLSPKESLLRRGANMPIDAFLHTLAEDREEKAIGVILSGTLSDGTQGMKAIKEYGGMVLAQEPKTAEHPGMPLSAINTGLVDFVLPVDRMPETIVSYVKHSYVNGTSKEKLSAQETDNRFLNVVLGLIQDHTKYDFRHYKKSTMVRRIERRMGLRQFEHLEDYLKYLRENPAEPEALFKDLLIGVTGFFREPELWDRLAREILPRIVDGLEQGETLRAWVPGCSTGEEAYTLGMLLIEAMETAGKKLHIQIFATDIDKEALTVGRIGSYPENVMAPVSKERAGRFFKKENGTYQVKKELRDIVMFSVHNLISDPPFSSLDLITCRNLLIYLEGEVQSKVIKLFHFALKEQGCLVLGNSETVRQHGDLFDTVSKRWRIFKRIGPRRPYRGAYPSVSAPHLPEQDWAGPPRRSRAESISHTLQKLLFKEYGPASVVINRRYEIVYLFGPTGKYLDLPEGEPVMDLTEMAKHGLKIKLRGAVHRALKDKEKVQVDTARVKREGVYHPCRITVRPLREPRELEGLLLVVFEDRPQVDASLPRAAGECDEVLITQMEQELEATREDLRATIEDLETANEELKASNEEMMSMNEELQSSNEELETSQEELQSLNEELSTVNAQLQDKVAELETVNNDLENFINSSDTATLFLDRDLRIRKFSSAAGALFNLTPTDVGRPVSHLAEVFQDSDLSEEARTVLDDLEREKREVATRDGRWFMRKISPYRTADNLIAGVVITAMDVSLLKESQLDLMESEERLRQLVENIKEAFWIRDIRSKKLLYASPGMENVLGLGAEDIATDPHKHLDIIHAQDRERVKEVLGNVLAGRKTDDVVYRIRKDGGVRWIKASINFIEDGQGRPYRYAGVAEDITEIKEQEQELRESEERFRTTFEQAAVGFAHVSPEGRFMRVNEPLAAMLGYTRDELMQRTFMDITHPDDLEVDLEKARHLAEGDIESYSLEKRYLRKDGAICWVNLTGSAVRNEAGEVDHFVAVVEDITQRKQVEDALTESENRLRQIASTIEDVVWLMDLDADRILYANPAFERIWRQPLERLYENKEVWNRAIHPEDLPEVVRAFARLHGEGTFECVYRIIRNNGEVRWIRDRGSLLNKEDNLPCRVAGVAQDITDLYLAQKETVQARDMLQTVFDTIPDLISVQDSELRVVMSNWKGARDVPPEIREDNPKCFSCYKNMDRPCDDCPALEVFKTGRPVTVERDETSRDGRTREIRAFPVFDDQAAVEYVVEHVRDITERIEAQQELQVATQCFNEVLNRSADLLYRYNLQEERYDYVSRSAQKVLGVDQQTLLDEGIQAFERAVLPEDLDIVRARMARLREAPGDQPVKDTVQFRVRDKDQGLRWLSERLTLIPGKTEGYRAVLGLVRDITGFIDNEQRIRQTLKEKDILLQEVHHRVKNNFQVISSLLNLSSKRISDPASMTVFLDMRSKIQSMSLIHTQIYQSDRFDRIDIAAYIKKLFRHLAKMYQKTQVRVEFDLEPTELSLDQAVPCGLVVNEALTNAFRHAFGDDVQGELSIRLWNEPQGRVHIRIEDDGRGLPEGFDPEQDGGMGLRIMHDLVVHQLGGRLDISGENGASVDIRFDMLPGDKT